MRTLKRITTAALALLMIFSAALLSSCNEGDSDYPVTVGGITVSSEPQNAVILDKNIADIVSCIGYDVKMVGRSDQVDQKMFKSLKSVGNSDVPSVDAIVKAGADIVLAGSTLDTAVENELKKKGITVASFEAANTPKQLKSLYRKIGVLLGGKNTGAATAQEAFDDLYDTYKELKSAAENSSTAQITVCYLYLDNGVLKTVNKGSWGDTVLGYTGTFNVFKNEDGNTIDPNVLRLANPNYIFCDSEEVVGYLTGSELLGGLDALDGRTTVVPYSDLSLQGYSGLEALRVILNTIYPNGD